MGAALLIAPEPARPDPADTSLLSIGLVSRGQVLRDSNVMRWLNSEEARLMRQLDLTIEAAKQDLAEEETALVGQKTTLSKVEFEERALGFDQRVRTARQVAQDRVSLVRRSFQRARTVVQNTLPQVLDVLRQDHGLDVLFDADLVLAANGGLLLTNEAIELVNAEIGTPDMSSIDVTSPLLPPYVSPSDSE